MKLFTPEPRWSAKVDLLSGERRLAQCFVQHRHSQLTDQNRVPQKPMRTASALTVGLELGESQAT